MRTFVILLVASVALAGCNVFGKRFGPSESTILARDWIPRDPAPAPDPLYCYRTLGTVECHGAPLDPAREDQRLVGAYGTTPAGTRPAPDGANTR